MENPGEQDITFKETIILAAGVIVFFVLRLFFISVPLDPFERLFAGTAAGIMSGKTPYLDFPNTAGPFAIYIYKIIFENIGKSTEAVRLFAVLYTGAAALVLYIFTRNEKRAAVSFAAFFIYLAASFNYNFCGINAGPEIFVHIPFLFAVIFLSDIEKEYEKAGYMIAGIFMGISALTTHIIWPALMVPFIFIAVNGKSKKEKTVYSLWYFGGVIITAAAALGWAVYNGNLKAFMELYFIFNINEYIRTGFGPGHYSRIRDLAAVSPVFLPGLAVMGYRIFKGSYHPYMFYVFFFSLFITAGIVCAKNPRPDSFMAVVPVLAYSGAFFAGEIMRFFKNRRRGVFFAYLFVLVSTGLLFYTADTKELFRTLQCAFPGS
ncbi:MAG: ArnT family glycosyltransferase [Candidatus Goldiibacteriota bacterium]